MFRQTQISSKELRIRELETEKIRQQLAQRAAELGNSIVSTAILIMNLDEDEPVEEMDRIFVEGDQTYAEHRQSVEGLTKKLRFLYATDCHESPTQEFRAEVQRVLERPPALD